MILSISKDEEKELNIDNSITTFHADWCDSVGNQSRLAFFGDTPGFKLLN